MNSIEQNITEIFIKGFESNFQHQVIKEQVILQQTRKEIEGDFTINVFPFVRFAKKSPEEVANILGAYIVEQIADVQKYNVIKGFLNLVLADEYWLSNFRNSHNQNQYVWV